MFTAAHEVWPAIATLVPLIAAAATAALLHELGSWLRRGHALSRGSTPAGLARLWLQVLAPWAFAWGRLPS